MPTLKILTLYPDSGEGREELIKQYLDLGWEIQGWLNHDIRNPSKGRVVHLTLGWLSNKPPVYPKGEGEYSL